MKGTLAELHALNNSWLRVMQTRPSEMNFAPFGFDEIDGEIIKSSIHALIEVVEAHVQKAKSVEKEDMSLVDAGAVRNLRDIRSWVDSATGNGVNWLLVSTEFFSRLSSVNSVIRQALGRNVDLRSRIVKLTKFITT